MVSNKRFFAATAHGDHGPHDVCPETSWRNLANSRSRRSGAWTEDGVYKAKLIFYETPFYVTFTLKLSGDRLLFDTEYNVVRRGSAQQPQLIGQVQ